MSDQVYWDLKRGMAGKLVGGPSKLQSA